MPKLSPSMLLAHLLVCLCAAVTPDSLCNAYDNLLKDFDIAGDLITAKGGSTDDCCLLCDKIPGCGGWSWFQNVCYLKSNVQGTYSNSGRLARVKTSTGNCTGFSDPISDQDLSGTLLSSVFASSMDHCCSACSEKSGCEGFSYSAKTCYLKSALQGTYRNHGVAARVKMSPVDCANFSDKMQDRDLSGDTLSTVFALSADSCCKACADVHGCQGFAFTAQTCYLKSNIKGTYNNPGVVTRCVGKCPGVSVVV